MIGEYFLSLQIVHVVPNLSGPRFPDDKALAKQPRRDLIQ